MNKNKLMIFGALFILGIGLIIVGTLMGKEESTEPIVASESNIPATEDNPLDGDTIGDMPSRGTVAYNLEDIYKTEEETNANGEEITTLEHEVLRYTISLPKEDMEKFIVEETERNNIISTAYYYKGKDMQAFVFAINNYPNSLWSDLRSSVSDIPLSSTGIRVLTYSVAGDNPFEVDTADYKAYMELIKKVPTYIERFEMTAKETE